MNKFRYPSNQPHQDTNRHYSGCQQCLQYQVAFRRHQQMYTRLATENKTLFETIEDFEKQNINIIGQCGKTSRQYEHLVQKLNNQLVMRDQIIRKLQSDVQNYEQELEKIEIDNDAKYQEYQDKISDLSSQIISLRDSYQTAIRQKENGRDKYIKEMKDFYQKQQNAQIDAQCKKLHDQINKLKSQLQIKDEIIIQKQELIKKFSTTNDSLMLELIDYKSKQPIESCPYQSLIPLQFHKNEDQRFQIQKLKERLEQLQQENKCLKTGVDKWSKMYQSKETEISIPNRSAGKVKKQAYELKDQRTILKEAWGVIISVYDQLKKTKPGNHKAIEEYQRKLWSGKLEYSDLLKIQQSIMRQLSQQQIFKHSSLDLSQNYF